MSQPGIFAPRGGTQAIFVSCAFLGSALLFAIQPIAVRMLLPSLGGSPAVWNAGMVFFQLLLLAGYCYAHWSLRWLNRAGHRGLYLLVMLWPLMVLPVAFPAGWNPPATSDPTLWTLSALAVMVGGPFFALATVSPTLQVWFASTAGATRAEPYALYAAGNAGSVLALLGYPLVVEPFFGLRAQAWGWAGGYLVFVITLVVCALLARQPVEAREAAPAPRAGWARRWRWMFYAAVPSTLLLGVTRHIADEIASFPLLWVVPLTLYLLTFIVTFSGRGARILPVAGRVARLLIIPALLSMFRIPVPLILVVVVHLALFSALALVLHQKLYESRPDRRDLTEFYVFLSLGGALGGVFVALIAPLVFDAVYEYPLAIALALLALPGDTGAPFLIARLRGMAAARGVTMMVVLSLAVVVGWMVSGSDLIDSTAVDARILTGVAGVIAYLMLDRPRQFALAISALLLAGVVVRPVGTVLQDRSFFGVLRVQEIGVRATMVHGSTLHGSQDRRIPGTPQGYFHPAGPAGATLTHLAALQPTLSVGIVGLGVGALAATLEAGDTLTFYEIDPMVARVASDPARFTYLAESKAEVSTLIGDGRLSLISTQARHDLLVIDAFSGDAIPVHLLTQEAMQLYGAVVGAGQVLIHISNRHLDLAHVVAATARSAGMDAWIWEYHPKAEEQVTGAVPSRWMLLMRPGDRPPPGNWWPIQSTAKPWTDDYSNIVGIISSQ